MSTHDFPEWPTLSGSGSLGLGSRGRDLTPIFTVSEQNAQLPLVSGPPQGGLETGEWILMVEQQGFTCQIQLLKSKGTRKAILLSCP